jgi:hypothetical protein
MNRIRKIAVHGIFVACVACGTSDPSDPSTAVDADPPIVQDAGPTAMPRLELGTGEDRFVPVADGDVLPMERGFQGLQHVWVSVRAHDFDPDRAIVALALTGEVDGTEVTDPQRLRLPFELGDGYAERVGMQLVVPEPDLALNRDLQLSVAVENRAGVAAAAEVRVRVQWEEELRGARP